MSLGAINNILGLWFQQRRGLAISLALNGASFSGVVIVPALVFLAGATGFATAMLAGAALILALMLPLAFTILARAPAVDSRPRQPLRDGRPPARPARRRGPGPPRCAASPSGACRRPSRSPSPRRRASSCTRSPSWSRRSAAPRAGIAVAITTAMAIVGRLTLGTMANWLDQRIASALSLASQAAALAVMMQTHATPRPACRLRRLRLLGRQPHHVSRADRAARVRGGRVRHADRALHRHQPVHLCLRAGPAGPRARRHRRLSAPRSPLCIALNLTAAAIVLAAARRGNPRLANIPARMPAAQNCGSARLTRAAGSPDCPAPMLDSAQTIGNGTGTIESAYAWVRLCDLGAARHHRQRRHVVLRRGAAGRAGRLRRHPRRRLAGLHAQHDRLRHRRGRHRRPRRPVRHRRPAHRPRPAARHRLHRLGRGAEHLHRIRAGQHRDRRRQLRPPSPR